MKERPVWKRLGFWLGMIFVTIWSLRVSYVVTNNFIAIILQIIGSILFAVMAVLIDIKLYERKD